MSFIRSLACAGLILAIGSDVVANPCLLSSNGAEDVLRLEGPTIAAFFPDVPHERLVRDRDLLTALEDFEWSVEGVRAPLCSLGVDVRVQRAARLVVKAGERRFVVRPPRDSAGIAYWIATPGKPPLMLQGVQTDGDLIKLALGYFGIEGLPMEITLPARSPR